VKIADSVTDDPSMVAVTVLAQKRDPEPLKLSGTAHSGKPHGSTKSVAKVTASVRVRQDFLALPVQGALFDSVDETDHQDHHEPEHAAKNDPGIKSFDVVAVHYGPRIHEHDLDIE
jgi:hypothetical protein